MTTQSATAGSHAHIIQVHGNNNYIADFSPCLHLNAPPPAVPLRSGTFRDNASLLTVGQEVTAFVGREVLLEDYTSWATGHAPDRPVSMRIITGKGGIGKTRFALELCRKLNALGDSPWQTGFVDGEEARRFLALKNLSQWDWQAPTLVVFDYALSLAEPLQKWLGRLCSAENRSYPLRLLLLERQAELENGWLERVLSGGSTRHRLQPRDLVDKAPESLPDITSSGMQRVLMQTVLDALGSGLVLPEDGPFFEKLGKVEWAGAPLFLMMAAMVMHRQGGVGNTLSLCRVDLAKEIAKREYSRFRELSDTDRSLEILLSHLAAFASVCGGLPGPLVQDVVRQEMEALEVRNTDSLIVAEKLLEALPDGKGGVASIAPDIIGESFVLQYLGNRQEPCCSDTLQRAFQFAPKNVAVVLIRCVQDFTSQTLSIDSSKRNSESQKAVLWLRKLGDSEYVTTESLIRLVDSLPNHTLALRELAVEWTGRVVAKLKTSPFTSSKHKLDQARALNNYSKRLCDLGHLEEALETVMKAVTIHRKLSSVHPDAFRTYLADSLNILAKIQSESGNREEALEAVTEAMVLYRELSSVHPDAFRPDLAMSLNNLAKTLSDLGRREEALEAVEEAVVLYRKLSSVRPDAFRPDLAMSLNNLANALSDLGQLGNALEAATEAVTIRRELSSVHPDAFHPYLAGSLNNLALILSNQGRCEEALDAVKEAVVLYRELSSVHPDVFRPGLAMSLNNLATILSDPERHAEALEAATEAVTIHRELSSVHPDAFRPDLAGSLNNLANTLSDLGRREDALEAATESAAIYLECYRQAPAAFYDKHQISTVTWLSLRLGIPWDEADTLYQKDPDAYISALMETQEES